MGCDLTAYLAQQTKLVNQALLRLLPAKTEYPEVIHQAMHYSLGAGGKRLRPILALAAAAAVGGDVQAVLPVACALECIHTYSLIHDDLPAMDNDDLRRGLPTNHKVYGEGMAILAGDALLTQAFQLLARELPPLISADRVVQLIGELAEASGSAGLVGGQVVDVQWERGLLTGDPAETLRYVHAHKTGSLLVASVRAGAIAAGADAGQLAALTSFAADLGVAFQITDDLLDVVGDESKLGKRVHKDASLGKLTYPGVYGVEQSRLVSRQLLASALLEIVSFGEAAEPLRALAAYLVERDH